MKVTKVLGIVAILFFFTISGTAFANFSYYIDDVNNGWSPYPSVKEFDFITTGNGYGYDDPFVITDGADLTYSVDFTFYAPDNWTDNQGPSNFDYTGYRPADDGLVYGDNIVSSSTSSPGSFDEVYTYFYTITNTGTTPLESFRLTFANADIQDYGYMTAADATYEAPESVKVNPVYDYINVDFLVDDSQPGEWYLASGETTTFFVTSQSWWGMGGVRTTGMSGSVDFSDGFELPSPNPEASTVLLYSIGLMGIAGFARIRNRKKTS